MKAESVSDNVQTDAAAIDTWALKLRLWLGPERVPHIVLDWDAPRKEADGHYQRFIYRVAQFQSLFPEWFSVADPSKIANRHSLTRQPLILNVASPQKRARSAQDDGSEDGDPSEHALELKLIETKALEKHFRLDRVGRQFPVGLFSKEVSAKTRIFTGGKSAIDLVGVGPAKGFWIFELKAGKNIPAGTLSEILLYTALIRDAAFTPARIRFAAGKPSSDDRLDPACVQQCTGINAVILVENLRPLLEHPHLLATLNNAAATHWNNEDGAKPVTFAIARVERQKDRTLKIGKFEKAAKAHA